MFGFIFRQFIQAFSNISDLLEVIFRLPFKTVAGGGGGDHVAGERGLVQKILLFIFRLLILPLTLVLNIVLLPVKALTVFSAERRRDFLLGIPAVLVVGLVATAAVRTSVQADAINNKYRGLSVAATKAEDFEKSQTYLARIVNSNPDPDPNDLLNWGVALLRTGDPRGTSVIARLAPNDTTGLPEAHRILASNLSSGLQQVSSPEKLKILKHHLDSAPAPTTPDLQLAWANYYIATRQSEKALQYLESAAATNPRLYLVGAEIAAANRNDTMRIKMLGSGVTAYEALLEKDIFDHSARIPLALIHVSLEQHQKAETVLRRGLELKDDREIRAAVADFLVARFDRTNENEPFANRLGYLEEALDLNVNCLPAYERVSRIHRDFGSERIEEIKVVLNRLIATGERPAVAHFTLSNIFWQEENFEDAKWHMEQAYRLQSGFLFIANNLAVILATREPKNLDRALELATEIVNKDDDPRFMDTLGTVYFEMGRFEEARDSLESALSRGIKDPELHDKLAEIYKSLGRQGLVAAHIQQAEELRQSLQE